MRVSSVMLGVAVLVLAVSLASIWFFPSVQDFMAANSMWNGIKNFTSESGAVGLDSLDNLPAAPEKTTLVTIPYLQYSGQELDKVAQFLRDGGTLLLMDDYGHGNEVLAYLGLEARFSGKPLLDPLFNHRNQGMPRITDFATGVKESGVEVTVLNHATALINVKDSEVIARSSAASFLDINADGDLNQDEPRGPLPVAASVRLGKGTVAIVADPSIMISSMVGRDDNARFMDYLTGRDGSQKTVLVDSSHLTKMPLDKSKDGLRNAREFLASPYILVGITAAIFVAVSAYTLRRGEIFG